MKQTGKISNIVDLGPSDAWHNIHITDKSGKKFFNTTASPMSTASEIKNLQRHLSEIKAGNPYYSNVKIDAQSAILMLDGSPYQSIDDILDDDLLNELFSE